MVRNLGAISPLVDLLSAESINVSFQNLETVVAPGLLIFLNI
jgi:hypothetical protein